MKKIILLLIVGLLMTSCQQKQEEVKEKVSENKTVETVDEDTNLQVIENEFFSIKIPKDWEVKKEDGSSSNSKGEIYYIGKGNEKFNEIEMKISSGTFIPNLPNSENIEELFAKSQKRNKDIQQELSSDNKNDCDFTEDSITGSYDHAVRFKAICSIENVKAYVENTWISKENSVVALNIEAIGEYAEIAKDISSSLQIKELKTKKE